MKQWEENIDKFILVFQEMGYEINDFPEEVKKGQQNISVKFSPTDFDLELITKFSTNRSFEESYLDAEIATIKEKPLVEWKVLNLDDLITSKIKAGKEKDLHDIKQLKKIKGIS